MNPFRFSTSPAPGDVDPHWSNVVALLKMDGAVGSETFVDNGPLTLPIGRTFNVRHADSWSVSGRSAEFHTGGGFLAIVNSALAFGTQDFTVEGFIRINNPSVSQQIFDARGGGQNGPYLAFGLAGGGYINLYVNNADRIKGAHGLSAYEPAHVAISRNNGKTRIFVKGLQVSGTFGDSTNYALGADRPVIGALGFDTGLARFLGFMDEIRITKGVGRYWKNFTPPTTAFPTVGGTVPDPDPDPTPVDTNWANVVALLKMDGAEGSTSFTDSSTYGRTVTAVGHAKVTQIQSKFGDGSLSLDGSGDRVTMASSSDLSFGTDDFTLEAFVCMTGGQNYARLIHFGPFWGNNDAWGINAKDADYSGKLTLASYKLGGRLCVASKALAIGVWHHVAVVRHSGVFYLFLDGNLEATNNTKIGQAVESSSSNYVAIGSATTTSGGEDLAGFVDNVRITKGVARYTSSFIPPAAPFPNTAP